MCRIRFGYGDAMAGATPNERDVKKRRVPQQTRSKERVERILDAAADLVATRGVEG